MNNTDKQNYENPVVSFCVPVYNNALAAQEIVKGLLSSDDLRFEVVVSDDNSRENVEELLSAIHDPRFRYYRNEKNLGAHKNWEHSLELGRGEWLYLVMGRDRMYGECVSRLIEILESLHENGITYLKDGGYNGRKDTKIYSGIQAMIRLALPTHPTGDIYSREIFSNIPNRTRYFEIADMYPECYIKHYLLLKGKGAFVNSGVFSPYGRQLVDYSKIKSGVENGGNIFDTYYAPRRKTIQRFEVIDLLDSDCPEIFTQKETDIFFRKNFSDMLYAVSEYWRQLCSDPVWQAHYGQPVRHVSTREMISNIITACRSTKSHLQEKGTFTQKRQAIIYADTVKALIKCITYYPFKRAVKKILEPLRIWDVLKRMKNAIKSRA